MKNIFASFQVIAARKGQKTSKYIGKKNISRDNWIAIKPKNFAVCIHEEKTIFPAKIVDYNVFLATSVFNEYFCLLSPLCCTSAFVIWLFLLGFYNYAFTVFKIAYMPSCFDVNVL